MIITCKKNGYKLLFFIVLSNAWSLNAPSKMNYYPSECGMTDSLKVIQISVLYH